MRDGKKKVLLGFFAILSRYIIISIREIMHGIVDSSAVVFVV